MGGRVQQQERLAEGVARAHHPERAAGRGVRYMPRGGGGGGVMRQVGLVCLYFYTVHVRFGGRLVLGYCWWGWYCIWWGCCAYSPFLEYLHIHSILNGGGLRLNAMKLGTE